jgi:hypothetical protein
MYNSNYLRTLFVLIVTSTFLCICNAGTPCQQPDNGTGTATFPPIGCEYTSPDECFMIIDGLPPGTTIELCGPLTNMDCSIAMPPGECEEPGGSLGGTVSCFAAELHLDVDGTGELTGYHRNLFIPAFCEVHTGPRNPGDPVQVFPCDMFRLHGEILGDPDFNVLRIIGGTDFGLPSPGETTYTQLPSGDFAVDSFFDITYQIEFEGAPGGPLEGLAGITTATIRMETGYPPIVIPAGRDYWATPEAEINFSDDPIPADFFGPGSDPFDGVIYITGNTIDPPTSLADTIIERLEDAELTDPPFGSDTIDVEIVELSLKSTEPITVTFDGGTREEYFDVSLDLHKAAAQTGTMTIDNFSATQGEFMFNIRAGVVFTFVNTGGGLEEHLLRDMDFGTVSPYPWQTTSPLILVRPSCETDGFYPSGQGKLQVDLDGGSGFQNITWKDPLPMDFDDDGDVDLVDFAMFSSKWLFQD